MSSGRCRRSSGLLTDCIPLSLLPDGGVMEEGQDGSEGRHQVEEDRSQECHPADCLVSAGLTGDNISVR